MSLQCHDNDLDDHTAIKEQTQYVSIPHTNNIQHGIQGVSQPLQTYQKSNIIL